MRRRVLAGLGWGLGMVLGLSGCQAPTIDPFLVLQVPASQRLYTTCNLRSEGEVISSINYQSGALLPFGTEVRLERVTAEEIVFRAMGMRQAFTLQYQQRYGVEPMELFLKKIFTVEDLQAQSRGIAAEVLRKLRAGQVEPGMTKAQVIKALGYPPAHRTPNLEADGWIYWVDHWNTFRIFFKDGKMLERQ